MPIDHADGLSSIYIPYDNEMIETSAEKHIFCDRMPFYVSDPSFVPLQLHQPVGQISRQSTVGDVPQFYLEHYE